MEDMLEEKVDCLLSGGGTCVISLKVKAIVAHVGLMMGRL